MNIVERMARLSYLLGGEGYPWADWSSQAILYHDYNYYYSGAIFDEFSAPQDLESPLMYPLKINLYRAVCETVAASLWGSYDDDLINFRVVPKQRGDSVTPTGRENAGIAQRLLNSIWRSNNRDSMLASAAISQMKYGGVYFRTFWDRVAEMVRIEAIPADMCFPVWSPTDADRLIAIIMAFTMSEKAVMETFKVKIDPDPEGDILVIEEWTEGTHRIIVGEYVLKNTPNPFGFIPFDYIPTRRDLEEWYGVPPGECIMGIQDEINKRLADIGDYLNYSAHPIRWVRDYRGNPKRDLPVGPDVVWNLGKTTNAAARPEVGTLKAEPVPSGTFEHISSLLGIAQDVVHIPPVAFGKDEGSQRSALTLVVRMWPLIQTIKYSRIYWGAGFGRIHDKALRLATTLGTASPDLVGHEVVSEFAPVMPKDRVALVDETISLVEAYLKSPEKALIDLGEEEPDVELGRIREWMKYTSEQNIVVQKGVRQRGVQA